MFNKAGVFILSAAFAMLWSLPLMADAMKTMGEGMKMPMRFTYEASPEQVLKTYPLGKLKKLAVLSHHGKADKEVQLPNGREGWVYDMGIHRTPKTYVAPSGKTQIVQERQQAGVEQAYTLVFGDDGHVIDVLYQGESKSMSALQLQSRHMMNR